MLVIKLAEQALRPKRIGSLTLPMASFGGPIKRGVIRLLTGEESEHNCI